jgi:hypothetical protein
MEKYEHTTLFTDAKGVLGGKVDKQELQYQLNQLGAGKYSRS